MLDAPISRETCARQPRSRIEPARGVLLASYHWPGNVRQLQTALRMALRLQPEALDVDAVAGGLWHASSGARRLDGQPTAADARAWSPKPASAGGVPTRRRPDAISTRSPPGRNDSCSLDAFEAAAGNKTAAGVLLGFHLSPGESDQECDRP